MTDDPSDVPPEVIGDVRARYRAWVAAEPQLHLALVALGRNRRGDPQRP